ncbi:MAG: helix-turn-helix domain-containing protein [Hyphomicrobium sp.]
MTEGRGRPPKLQEADRPVPIGSRHVRSLLNRHGVPPTRHATLIAEVLGFGYTLVHRRIKGDVAWELEEIEKVAAHFGESLASVFATTRPEDMVPAVLSVDGARIACRLLAGDVLREPERNSLVAVKVGAQWVAAAASQAGVGPCFEVRQLHITSDAERPRRIAILDDDEGEAASLAEYFAGRGCEAQAFTDVESLVAHMRLRPFDAYVIDWVLDEGTAAELLAMIRAEDPECPVAVLTGKMEGDIAVETAVAEALSTYKLMFFQKPTRLPLIASQLLRALAGQ